MKIAGGHTCIRGLRSGAASSSSVEIISPAQFGKVRVLGPGFSYEAKADYQGPDTFTLRVSGTLMKTRGPLRSWSSWKLAENSFSVLGD